MFQFERRVLLVSETPELREKIEQTLYAAGWSVTATPRIRVRDISAHANGSGGPPAVVLEMASDAERLLQAVNECYRFFRAVWHKRAAIVAVASEEMIGSDPTKWLWLIDGRAALMALVPVGDSSPWISEVAALLDRIPPDYFNPSFQITNGNATDG